MDKKIIIFIIIIKIIIFIIINTIIIFIIDNLFINIMMIISNLNCYSMIIINLKMNIITYL